MSENAGWQRARRIGGFDACFVPYLRWLIARNFAALRVRRGVELPTSGGYVAAANHHSWWDGFIPYVLHHAAASSQPFALMMSDVELRRFPFFRFGGAFSVDARSVRAALPSIMYAAHEAQRGAAVWIFPDGVLQPPLVAPHFTSGFVHVAREAGVPILPVAIRLLFLGKQRPEAFVALGEPVDARRRDALALSHRCVLDLLRTIDEEIVEGEVDERYRVVIGGASGVDDRVSRALKGWRERP